MELLHTDASKAQTIAFVRERDFIFFTVVATRGLSRHKMGRGIQWTDQENECCTRAWLAASENVRKGCEMRGNLFIDSMYQHFEACAKRYIKDDAKLKVALSRNKRPVIDRWKTVIMPAITKFVGIKKKVDNINQSGITEEDSLRQAHDEYEDVYKAPFEFEGCWRIAKGHPKWSLLSMSGSNCSPSIKTLPEESKQKYGRDVSRRLAAVDSKERNAFSELTKQMREASRESAMLMKEGIDKFNEIQEAKLNWRMFSERGDSEAKEFKSLMREKAVLKLRIHNKKLRDQLQGMNNKSEPAQYIEAQMEHGDLKEV